MTSCSDWRSTRFPRITLSGVDEDTDLDVLAGWAQAADGFALEIGLLYSATPEGRHRYPRLEWLQAAAARYRGPFAIHICGSVAREQFLAGKLTDLIQPAQRVQLNGLVRSDVVRAALAVCPGKQLITQHHAANDAVTMDDIGTNHAVLVDGSAGSGTKPDGWLHPGCAKPVGFAGGLGPENLAVELPKIRAEARPPWWIDMEQRLRSADDRFDLARAERCVAIFAAAIAPAARAAAQHAAHVPIARIPPT